jgi:hypothetical protein
VAGTNIFIAITGIYTNTISTLPVRTNWPADSITNATWLTNGSALYSTNIVGLQTNWPMSAITNATWQKGSLNLTNWSLLDTNALNSGMATNVPVLVAGTNIWIATSGLTNTISTLATVSAQTNWPLSSITNANNLTNWSTLSTNVLAASGTSFWATNTDGTITNQSDLGIALRATNRVYFGDVATGAYLQNVSGTLASSGPFSVPGSLHVGAITGTGVVLDNGAYYGNGVGLTNIPMRALDWSGTNAVTTNAVALKIPAFTNGATIFYLLLFTNVP